MSESIIANVATIQRRKYYANILMNESTMTNVITTQRRRYYASTSMNESTMTNVITTQRRRCCSFDSPGLARNEPTLGKRSQGDSTP
ncbi:tetrahydrofolate synthase [Prevotella salivae]|uniref:Tetrahydrofolate synthase n=1 Tax=Segatella salivae TaxID=228604 RepID=A0AAW4NRI8_9BACT|nr:tetrahydrofolate synthase [Segatella salivae]MBW4865980.1 tetrahydrofolate synthase [Segatella salivae]MBW4910022.1 tetrahydrofolate synthase [Segatella salivae]